MAVAAAWGLKLQAFAHATLAGCSSKRPVLAVVGVLAMPLGSFAATLSGPVGLQVYFPDLAATSLRNTAAAVVGAGLEFGTAAGGTPSPGTFIVGAGIDVSANAITVDYHDAAGDFITSAFNGYVLTFPALAGAAIYSVAPGAANNLPAQISYTRNSIRINVSGLPYSSASLIDLQVQTAAPSYASATGLRPLISAELVSGTVTATSSVYLSGSFANNLTGESTAPPAGSNEDDIIRKAREIRDLHAQREALFRKASDFAGQQIGAGGAQASSARGAAYGIVVDQLIAQTPQTTPLDQGAYEALAAFGSSASSYATWVYSMATSALAKGAERISGITARRWDEVIPPDPVPPNPAQRGLAEPQRAAVALAATAADFHTLLTRGPSLNSTIAEQAGARFSVVDLYIESFAAAVEDMQLASDSLQLAQAALSAGDRAAAEAQMAAVSDFMTGSELSFIDAAGHLNAARSMLNLSSTSLGSQRNLAAGQTYLRSFGLTAALRERLLAAGFTDADIDAALASALALTAADTAQYSAADYVGLAQEMMALGRPSTLISAVPEPTRLAMLLLGLAGLLCWRKANLTRT